MPSNSPTKAQLAEQNETLAAALDEQTEKFEQQDAKFSSIEDSLAKLTEAVSASLAKNNPVILNRSGGSEFDDRDVGQQASAEFSTHRGLGEENPSLIIPSAGESVDSPAFQDKAAVEAFMSEMIHVQVHDTAERNAEASFSISVNGKPLVFQRGSDCIIPRRYVEGLARCKPRAYRNEEFTNDQGVRAVRWPSTTGMRYGFSVIEDRNPRGKAWLQGVLAQKE